MRVLLIETIHSGHHPAFLRAFRRALIDLGHGVEVLVPPPDQQELGGFPAREARPFPFRAGPLRPPLSALRQWRTTREDLDDARRMGLGDVDLCLFASLDPFLAHALSARLVRTLFPLPFVGLWVRPSWYEPPRWPRSRSALPTLARLPCRGLWVLDDDIPENIKSNTDIPLEPLADVFAPAPPDLSHPLVRRLRAYARGRPLVVAAGKLGYRKGLASMLAAARADAEGKVAFAAVGTVSWHDAPPDRRAQLEEELRQAPSNLLVIDEPLRTERAFNAALGAADIVWLAYEGFPWPGSQVLSKAATWDRPVVAGPGRLGERVFRGKLGAVAPDLSGPSLLAATLEASAASSTAARRAFAARQGQGPFTDGVKRLLERASL